MESGTYKSDASNLETLRRVCAGELLRAFGLDGERGILTPVARLAVGRLAERAIEYDRLVGEGGLGRGGDWALRRVARRANFSGEASIPGKGPLMVVSNHPGLSDTVALFSAIPRNDLMVIAARREFLDALPNTARRLFILEEGDGGSGVVRAAARHMRGGGSLLTFPGGRIEPDPASTSGAAGSLAAWSGSLDLFARLVPGLTIVPAIVSGVVSRGAHRNPLLYLRRREEDRRWLAATLQMIFPSLYAVDVRVDFGRPVSRASTDGGLSSAPPGEVSREVIRQAKRLISIH
ncbi:MAG: hypothetical protein ACR2KW_00950 [Rubrobacter sp.]